MEFRIQTQSAWLRSQRDRDSQTPVPEKPVKNRIPPPVKSKWGEATKLESSANLRPEVRSVNQARADAITDFNDNELHEQEVQHAFDRLADLRELASNRNNDQESKGHSEYEVLMQYLEDISSKRVEPMLASGVAGTMVEIGEDYQGQIHTGSTDRRMSLQSLNETAGRLGDYRELLKSIRRKLEDRLGDLSVSTRRVTMTNPDIESDSCVDEMAKFTQESILTSAKGSVTSQANIKVQMALSLIQA